MANPASTTRQTPVGYPLKNGHATKVAFARLPTFSVWEREVGMPGVMGGDPINITTMHNVTWETLVEGALRTLTPFTVTGLYDPRYYTDVINTLVNENGSITVSMSDGSTIDFFGILNKSEPQPCKKNETPTVQLTITPTNYDPVNRVEAGPVITQVSGT